MKLIILLSLLLTGCLNNDDGEVSSGGGIDGIDIAPNAVDTYLLAATKYNFTGIRRIIFYNTGENIWMQYNPSKNEIKINPQWHSRKSLEENACALVHELAHHNGADEPEAYAEYHQCLRVI